MFSRVTYPACSTVPQHWRLATVTCQLAEVFIGNPVESNATQDERQAKLACMHATGKHKWRVHHGMALASEHSDFQLRLWIGTYWIVGVFGFICLQHHIIHPWCSRSLWWLLCGLICHQIFFFLFFFFCFWQWLQVSGRTCPWVTKLNFGKDFIFNDSVLFPTPKRILNLFS